MGVRGRGCERWGWGWGCGWEQAQGCGWAKRGREGRACGVSPLSRQWAKSRRKGGERGETSWAAAEGTVWMWYRVACKQGGGRCRQRWVGVSADRAMREKQRKGKKGCVGFISKFTYILLALPLLVP